MKIFTDPRLLQTGLVGGMISRHGGDMGDFSLQARALDKVGVPFGKIVHFHQTHSTRMVCFSSEKELQSFPAEPLQEADAWLFSPAPAGWGAAVVTADCVPLFLWTQDANAWALAHCGWRGVAAKLPLKLATAFKEKTNMPLFAWAGPHIQPCCFEVQQDTAQEFPLQTIIRRGQKQFVDLNAALRLQLQQAGIPPENIHCSLDCTSCDKENFFSWRRDHQRNRLLSFVYKP